MTESLRIAVAGASGIGKHHAKWFTAAGCEVVALCGSSEASARTTGSALKELFGFDGRAYADLDQMLAREQPDILDVCTPNALHFEFAVTGLRHGCHVLCEKPLVWDSGAGGDATLEQAGQLVDEAEQRGLRLAVCTQYAAALPLYQSLFPSTPVAPGEIVEFHAEMATLARGPVRDAAEVWVDMAPHPLSLLLAWLPDGRLQDESLQAQFAGDGARVQFEFLHDHGSCSVHIAVRDQEGGIPERRFGINGRVADCSGRPAATGEYQSVLGHGAAELAGQDFMSLLIEQFANVVRGEDDTPLAAGTDAVNNLRLQWQIMETALAW